MSDFSIKSAVLYRAGIGWFTAEGHTNGGDVVYFPLAEEAVNDFLKTSLISTDNDTAVKNISFETLGTDLSLFPTSSAIKGLYEFLRGTQCKFVVLSDGEKENLEGKIMGYQDLDTEFYISILTSDNKIKNIKGVQLTDIVPEDDDIQTKLYEFLNTLNAIDENQKKMTLRISLTDRNSEKILVQFMAEVPSWKISYRLLIKQDESITLETYGIVDNTTLIDFVDANLKLSTSLPISFQFDLSTPHMIDRETIARVTDTGIITPQPEATHEPLAEPAEEVAEPKIKGRLREFTTRSRITRDVKTQATTEIGESVEYSLDQPVTIKRNESAMVPLSVTCIDGKLTRYYNSGNHKYHPFYAVEFTNDLGYALDKGPLSVHSNQFLNFKGESMLPRTGNNETALITYALDRNVVIEQNQKYSKRYTGVSISDAVVFHKYTNHRETIFKITNRSNDDIKIYCSIQKGKFKPKQVNTEFMENQTEYRFKVDVGANSTKTEKFPMEYTSEESSQLANLGIEKLEELIEETQLSEEEKDVVLTILGLSRKIIELQSTKDQIQQKISKIENRREQIISTLEVLDQNTSEDEVRRNYISELEKLDDNLQKQVVQLENTELEINKLKSQRRNP